jgi:hypothetical protein
MLNLSNKQYDTVKTVALLVAPAFTLIGAVLNIWDVPYTPQITATLAAIDTFVGVAVATLGKTYTED